MPQYALVTYYIEPGKRAIVHTYGPYTQAEVNKLKRRIHNDRFINQNWLAMHVCKLLRRD